MVLDKDTVATALEGVLLYQFPVLWETSEPPTENHRVAIELVHENLNDFRWIVMDEIQHYPYFNHFFGHLIQARLIQANPLESPIVQKVFPIGPVELENRLNRIAHISNIDKVSTEARLPNAFEKGEETDEIIRDVWTEFLIADFLVAGLGVNHIEKIVSEKSQPAVEYYVHHEDEEWIVEVARLRKRDFTGETMPWGSSDCTKPENVAQIRKALRSKLSDKNKQIQKFVGAEGRDFDKRIVAIKTSQEEYQDCYQVVAAEATKLMNEKAYSEITHLLLFYDTESYEFIENVQARQ
jgi:hypothetical protein